MSWWAAPSPPSTAARRKAVSTSEARDDVVGASQSVGCEVAIILWSARGGGVVGGDAALERPMGTRTQRWLIVTALLAASAGSGWLRLTPTSQRGGECSCE